MTEAAEQVALIEHDMEYGSRLFTPYRLVMRWSGGWDKTIASNIGPRNARDLYAMLARSWSPYGDPADIPIRGDGKFQVVVYRTVEHVETDVTEGMNLIATNF